MLTLQESIRPSADLRNHYDEISTQCKDNNEAVIITANGRKVIKRRMLKGRNKLSA